MLLTAPTESDLEIAGAIVDRQPWTLPHLAFLRDKALLFDDRHQGFVMYRVQGRTWVALGDPVGPPERVPDLVRRFLRQCGESAGVPVFYEVREDQLTAYTECGLTAIKLGEEARVDLTTFTLAGRPWAKHRQHLNRLNRAGVTFRVVDRTESAGLMTCLRAVSEEWLATKPGGEKGFSMGFFDVEYLSRCDLAVMEQDGQILAFTNLWSGARHFELATDLIRHRADAPAETMEALLVHVMIWGKRQGYRWFSLGMAPLSGLHPSASAPIWSRVASFVYGHCEAFYPFRGVRTFKQKFHPLWEPRFLIYRPGSGLPRIVADASALIAGGYRRLLLKSRC